MNLIKSLKILILVLPGLLTAQDFSRPFSNSGVHSYYKIKQLRDSSIVSIVPVNYLSKKTNQYDSVELLFIRQNKKGDVLYYAKIISPDTNYHFDVLDFEIIEDKIYLSGYIVYPNIGDDIFGLIIRLNSCFEVELYNVYKYKDWTANQFNSITKLNDNQFIVQCQQLIKSDSVFTTILCFDNDLNLMWNSTFHGEYGDIALTGENVHIWGDGYYPRQSDPNIVERKLNYVILNKVGKIKYQLIENKNIDFIYSAGSRIISSINNKFIIACVALKPPLVYFNGLRKMDANGNLLKSVTLNSPNEKEVATSIFRINDNRFIVVAAVNIDFDYQNSNLYLIDSNLNVVRKKRILSNFNYVALSTGISYSDGALLAGHFIEKLDDLQKAILYRVDTFLNVTKLPSVSGFSDSLCLNPNSAQFMYFPKPDTLWLETLNLRKNLYQQVSVAEISVNSINIYPNPSSGKFTISLQNPQIIKLIVYDVLGNVIFQNDYEYTDTIDIALNEPYSGLLFIRLQSDVGVITKTVLMQ